jgi:hypothetical protein
MKMDQCAGRLDRTGQKQPVFAHIPLSSEGSDPILADLLDLKRDQAEGIRDPFAPTVKKIEIPDNRRMLLLATSVLLQHAPEELAALRAAGTLEQIERLTVDMNGANEPAIDLGSAAPERAVIVRPRVEVHVRATRTVQTATPIRPTPAAPPNPSDGGRKVLQVRSRRIG